MMVRARRAVREHDLVGFDRVIELGNAAAQRLTAPDIAIGQALGTEVLQKVLLVLARELEKLVERNGVDAGLGDVVERTHLVLVHPFFHSKGLDVHIVLLFSIKK